MLPFLFKLAVLVASLAISALTYRPPPQGKTPKPGEAKLPQANEGSEIGFLIGTGWIGDAQIVYQGKTRTKSIKKKGARKGLFGPRERVTVGHYYYKAFQALFFLGAADRLLELRLEKKPFWRGSGRGGRIFWKQSKLFGGKEKRGGTSGYADVEFGLPDQMQNDYLRDQLGSLVPAYRGVTQIVFRRPYWGTTDQLPRLSAKFEAVYVAPDGSERWYKEKAGIPNVINVGPLALFIAMDVSGSMSGSRMASQKAAVVDLIEAIRDNSEGRVNIRIVTWSDAVKSTTERRNCKASDFAALVAWVEGLSNATSGGTDFEAAVSTARVFFNGTDPDDYWENLGTGGYSDVGGFHGEFSSDGAGDRQRVMVFMTDGQPDNEASADAAEAILDAIASMDRYAFNIDLSDTTQTEKIDNTPGDGVPVLNGTDTAALFAGLGIALNSGLDLNVVHGLREVILFPSDASSANASQIGDSFTAAADTCFAEKFGVSLLLENAYAKRDNLEELEKYADARVFRSRSTNKWEIKLIRDDYDINDLLVLDRSNVKDWGDFVWKDPRYQPNQVTVVYTHPTEDRTESITITDPVRRRLAGHIINQKNEYPGIRSRSLASKVAFRDLHALGNSRLSGFVRSFPLAADLNVGSPVLVNNAKLGIENVVCRVSRITEGDGRTNEYEIDLLEDAFSQPDAAIVAEPVDPVVPDYQYPEAVDLRLVEEAPYYVLQRELGDLDANDLLSKDPTTGFLNVAGDASGTSSIEADISVDTGSGFEATGLLEFCPVILSLTALSREADDTRIVVEQTDDLPEITTGSIAAIGAEYLRVDSVEPVVDVFGIADMFSVGDVFGEFATIQFGRGCLDTVPQTHAAGSPVFFWSEYEGTDGLQYYDSDVVDIKLLTLSSLGTLEEAEAATDEVTFASRANRPYPPGQFQAEGSYADLLLIGDVTLTWAHRDRTLQPADAVVDHTSGDIGPEAGVTYRVTAWAVDEALVPITAILDVSVGTDTDYVVNDLLWSGDVFTLPDMFALADVFNPVVPGTAAVIRFDVTCARGGLSCWQSPSIYVTTFKAPGNLTAEVI